MIPTHRRPPIVHFPSELEESDFVGNLYGYHHADSNEYNIVAWGKAPTTSCPPNVVGTIIESLQPPESSSVSSGLIGIRMEQGLEFRVEGQRCRKQPYDLLKKIFSRNTGILETDVMLDKCVLISGCGSVGSLVALELARAGVGSFVLVDNDTIAYHNLCRHQCGVEDVGKFKVNAVKERILQTNPTAQVAVYPTVLERLSKAVFDEFCHPGTIIVGCADNREGDVYGSKIANIYNVPFVSIGLWNRAFAGEVFYFISGQMPCYACLFEKDMTILERSSAQEEAVGAEDVEDQDLATEFSGRISMSSRFYLDEEAIAESSFEPGISTDISFVTLIGVKLIIDLLNRDTSSYIPRLLNHLQQYTWVCNTSDPRLGGERAEIFSYPLQVTTSLTVNYRRPCPPCKYLS